MESDLQLLRRYAADSSESAFGEVVTRHLGWAYATALRQTGGDAHGAQDIAQAVFATLAIKAASLPEGTVLVGWLYRAIIFEAQREHRSNLRRRLREQTAMELANQPPEPDWESVKPVLDDSLGRLPESDRMAILLRYFDRRSLKEIGEILRCGESGASRRTTRALDKLRRVLASKGIHTTAGALSVALMANTSVAAPAGLASVIAAASVSAATTAAATAPVAGTLLTLLPMTKLQLSIVAAIAIVGVGTPIYLQVHTSSSLRLENERLRAEVERLSTAGTEPRPAAETSPDPNGIAADKLELIRLRGEIATLRQQQRAVASNTGNTARNVRPREEGNPGALPPNFIPVANIHNTGIASPGSSFETYAWAKANHDLTTMANALVLDDNARIRAEALLQSLPESQRSQYPSAEYLLASLIAQTTDVAGLHVTGETPSGPDETIVHAEWQYNDGRIRDGDLRYHHYPDGWRQVIPQGLVDKLGGLVGQPVSSTGTSGK